MNEWIAWFSLGIKVFPSPPPSSLCNSCRTETNLALHVSASVAIFCITWFLLLFLVLFERLFFALVFTFFWEGLDGWIVSSFGTNVFFFRMIPFVPRCIEKKLFYSILFCSVFGSVHKCQSMSSFSLIFALQFIEYNSIYMVSNWYCEISCKLRTDIRLKLLSSLQYYWNCF